MMYKTGLFRGVIKLKTLCIGGQFAGALEQRDDPFPNNVLAHEQLFQFFIEESFENGLDIVFRNRDIDLVFLDADYDPLSEITMFMTQALEIRPKLPLVVFTSSSDDKMRRLMREGAVWHFNKHSKKVADLPEQIQQHVFPLWIGTRFSAGIALMVLSRESSRV